MAAPDPLPVWAKKTLHDADELVDNPTDPRRTRSQFFEAPTALATTKKMLPIHCYMSLVADPQSYTEATGNPFWEAAKRISLQYCLTEQQVADIFTKSFTEKKFSDLWEILVVVETTG